MSEYVSTPAINNAAGDYKQINVQPYAGSLGADIWNIELAQLDDAGLQ